MSPFGGFTLGHLGRRVSALVDDQLPPDERERALAHLVGCPHCRVLVDAEVTAKATLRTLGDPAPPPGLLAGLLDLGGPSGPLPRDRSGFPGSGPPASPGWSLAPRRPAGPAGRPGPLRRTDRGPARVAIVAVGAAGASLGLAFAAGGATPAPVAPAVVPAFDRLTTEHVRTTGGTLFSDPPAVTAALPGASTPRHASPSPRSTATTTAAP